MFVPEGGETGKCLLSDSTEVRVEVPREPTFPESDEPPPEEARSEKARSEEARSEGLELEREVH